MISKIVTTRLPTDYGQFDLHLYQDKSAKEHLALSMGEQDSAKIPIVRIHSECLTGDLFTSRRCDCGQQLHASLKMISESGCGVLIYLRQEGRGIGLINKLHAYNLQDEGLDTIEANLKLGFESDQRDYNIALQILLDLQIKELKLITNNPEKLKQFSQSPIKVVERIALNLKSYNDNIDYLKTKRDRMGHLLDL
ncbi:GTP cyclohydrolase II [Candidatus Uabimicrobium amorphum]|uniref:GTP cyclohydrolase-2 n=1 Tax=Uabimicrobium amorphum TaxID=2596890 RepID=A0A5S9IN00_UABAM|nr:GTP cyclohydrolase II [Candidatus Uabimicrobium amorphum]BBM84030.1 riboflavin biosynthesis protein RibBA [Candidatus Uabimicrobium amorphum]